MNSSKSLGETRAYNENGTIHTRRETSTEHARRTARDTQPAITTYTQRPRELAESETRRSTQKTHGAGHARCERRDSCTYATHAAAARKAIPMPSPTRSCPQERRCPWWHRSPRALPCRASSPWKRRSRAPSASSAPSRHEPARAAYGRTSSCR